MWCTMLGFLGGLLRPAVFVSVYQQLTEHKHDGMAVGHKYVNEAQIRNKTWTRKKIVT